MSTSATLDPYTLAELLGQLPPTDEQAKIIESDLEPLLVIAGAGSGKTTTMADRVVWLVANGFVLPEEILGVTFTRKAAGELSARIRKQLAKLAQLARSGVVQLPPAAAAKAALDPKVSTYHSYAAGIVADYGLRKGIERDAVVLGAAQSWQLAMTVVEAFDGDYTVLKGAKSTLIQAVIKLAGECSEHLQDPADVREYLDTLAAELEALPYLEGKNRTPTAAVADLLQTLRSRAALASMVEEYAAAKRARNVLDYGDLVALAATIAQDVPQAGALERARYKVVLLDEFQDTSHAQLQLFAHLFGGGHAVLAVGDPHQSIYGFRGASAGQLFEFPSVFLREDSRPAATAELTTAWRNSTRILDAANVMSAELNTAARLRHPGNPVRVSPLKPRPQADAGQVELTRFATERAEADALAASIAAARSAAFRHDEPLSVAVLCRKRSQFAVLTPALESAGIPYEVVGLGGLLSAPEVVDLVAELRVVADPTRSDALMRLLTGARWRIGPADLMALAAWSKYLARRRDSLRDTVGAADRPEPEEVAPDVVESASLVEAVDSLSADFWPPSVERSLTPTAIERLLALRDELRYLRSFSGDDLITLLGEVERTMRLDIELAAKPGASIHSARRNLDAFAQAAVDFVQTGERVDLLTFLAWLEAAADQENGLIAAPVEVNPEAVQLLTVHAAKGLEWDAVYVPGMNEGSFPSKKVDRWTAGSSSLPWPLRGDRKDLPVWDVEFSDQKGWVDSEKEFAGAVIEHAEEEERRLAYVAFTRARNFLWCSSSAWSLGRSKPSDPSPFLSELLPLLASGSATGAHWCADDAVPDVNPLSEAIETANWPYDPLEGPEITGRPAARVPAGRRKAVEDSAAAVRALVSEDPATLLTSSPRWGAEASALLALRDAESQDHRVELPSHISASMLVDLADDPQAVTRQLRRPVPHRPGMAARAGTAFHLWVEDFFGTTGQLELEEIPAADAYVDAGYAMDELQATFKASSWALREPAEIEVPIETQVSGVVVRGRIDAVFRDDDGGWDLVDWKTGKVPSKAALAVRSVQLAVYRLAFARLKGVPLDMVRAAFYYVGADSTIRPHDLAGEAELEAIIAAAVGDN
ncbi:MAG: ATP-dependent helicase [Acidobacteria bacterium]|nr:ATP-dependent helicase [Acidobacteriota bacterium]